MIYGERGGRLEEVVLAEIYMSMDGSADGNERRRRVRTTSSTFIHTL